MKMIIDIDKQHFELLQMAVMNGMGDNAQKIIAQGIPFEQIRAEIDRQEKWLLQAGYTAYNVDIAFDSIKSVLAESEE